MIKFIEGLPDNVIAVEAVGKVEADDYRNVLDPAIAKAIETHDRLRFLYVIGEAYDGFTAGAMWQDTKVGLGDRKAWERIAVVSDHRALVDALGVRLDGLRRGAHVSDGRARRRQGLAERDLSRALVPRPSLLPSWRATVSRHAGTSRRLECLCSATSDWQP